MYLDIKHYSSPPLKKGVRYWLLLFSFIILKFYQSIFALWFELTYMKSTTTMTRLGYVLVLFPWI